MRKRQPLISAWVGRGNFGDELLAYGLRLELYRLADIPRISYHESGEHAIYRAPDDAPIDTLLTTRDGRLRRLLSGFAMRRQNQDVLFFGGGSVLHSEHSIRWKQRLLKQFRRNAGKRDGSAVGVGLSLGPFSTQAAVHGVREFISGLDLLICRDLSSANFARELGTPTPVIDGRDLAYGVKVHHPELFVPTANASEVGISFILNPALDADQRTAHLAQMRAIIDRITNTGRRVVLIALYSAGKYADDRLAYQLHTSARHPERVSVHHYRGDVAATTRRIASCTHFVSMRLHGGITAHLCGIPVLTLNRHPKVVEFAREAGITDAALDLDCPLPMIGERMDALMESTTTTARLNPVEDHRYRDSIASLETLIA